MKITRKKFDEPLQGPLCEYGVCRNYIRVYTRVNFESKILAYEWIELLKKVFSSYLPDDRKYAEIWTCKKHADYLYKILKKKESLVFDII